MRVALPKGRLLEGVLDRLQKAGLTFAFQNDRDYRPVASERNISAKLFKVRAIPQLVALGQCDVGFCGLDLLREANYDLVEPVLDLGLNAVELVVAVRRGEEHILTSPPKRPLLIASEYQRLADEWALDKNLAHITIQTYGSTEAYAPEDADIVFDCTETGRTIEANGLVVIDRICKSTTHLVANKLALHDRTTRAHINTLKRKLARAQEHTHG